MSDEKVAEETETPAPTPVKEASEAREGDGRRRRRLPSPLALFTMAVAGLFIVLAIGTPLLGLRVFSAADQIFWRAPWASSVATGFAPENIWVSDTIDSVAPQSDLIASELRHGDLAMWNPYITGGVPLGVTPNLAMFSPLSLPWFLMPSWLAPGYVKLLEMIVAIGGCFLFLRRLRLSSAAAWVGGLVFAGSAFFITWTNWPQTRVAAFIPVLFWAAERLVQERRIRDGALLAAAVASMLLGGFPAVTGLTLYVAGPYFLLRVITLYKGHIRRIIGLLAAAGGAVAAGVLLAAGQLLPFAAMLKEASIGERAQGPQSHLDFRSLITSIAPSSFGTLDPTDPPAWFGFAHPIESMSFIGAAAVVLAVLGAVVARRANVPWGARGFFVAAALVFVVLIYWGGAPLAALQHLPVFSNNHIGRARSVLGFFIAVLAAMGYDALIRSRTSAETPRSRQRLRIATGVVVWLGAAAGLGLLWRDARRHAITAHQGAFFGNEMRSAVLIVLVSLGCVLVAFFAGRWLRGRPLTLARGAVLAILPLLIVSQSLPLARSFWPRIQRDEFYPTTQTHTFLQQNLGHDRYASLGDTMSLGTSSFYRLRSLEGHAFVDDRFAAMIKAVYPSAFRTPTYVQLAGDPNEMNPAVLDRLGIRYLVASPGSPMLGEQKVTGVGDETLRLLPGEAISVPLPSGGPLRGVGVALSEIYRTTQKNATLDVSVLDSRGQELAHGSRRMGFAVASGNFNVPIAGEELPRQPLTVRLVLHSDDPVSLLGHQGTPQLTTVESANDGVRVVRADATTIYERQSALPRIRWASQTVVEADKSRAIELLKEPASQDGERVVLEKPGPVADGKPATVRIDSDAGDQIEATVTAQGAGYLVVADALQDNWSVTVDGAPATLRVADYGLVAVALPAGTHKVRLAYTVPYNGVGGWISLGTGVVIVGLLVVEWRWLRRRNRSSAPQGDAGPAEIGRAEDQTAADTTPELVGGERGSGG